MHRYESLFEKMYAWTIDSEIFSATKVSKNTTCGYLIFAQRAFNTEKNKLDYYRVKNFIKTFFKDPKDYTLKIIN